MTTKVAINGLGRIGSATLKIILETPELEVVALNDLLSVENLAYLLTYDSVYGRYEKEVVADKDGLQIDGKLYRMFNEKDPAQLPWGNLTLTLCLNAPVFFGKTRPGKASGSRCKTRFSVSARKNG
ncbi:MAG: glyceraldehyde 3-phosphate dehydrogenase NAD-binding domain-containing protein [Desulfotignum sp.]|nr:glyceraldehyde 3-phosphate dehydrogenase NAD-binding domain-containing protein [Desulfotignum sp.]